MPVYKLRATSYELPSYFPLTFDQAVSKFLHSTGAEIEKNKGKM